MNYTHLGRTGLKVSRLCLGTMNFGDVTDEKTSARISLSASPRSECADRGCGGNREGVDPGG